MELLTETVLWGLELEADDAQWNYHFQQAMIRQYGRYVGEVEDEWSDETNSSDAEADVNESFSEEDVVNEE